MPIFGQTHVKEFIEDEVLGKLEFNYHERAGAHSTFIARAAKASGLSVRKIGKGHYFYDGPRSVGSVESMVSSLISYAAVNICKSKQLTKDLLSSVGVPVPRGKTFEQSEESEALQFFSSLTEPCVVKPDGGRGGKGVTCGVRTEEHFRKSWKHAVSASKRVMPIIVEEFVTGIDLRVYVVGGQFIAASTRVPPFVVGDGNSSIGELLAEKQAIRNRNLYLARMPIVVDERWILNSGNTIGTVLERGEIAVLNSTVNLHQGGENVDVTEILAESIKLAAVATVAAIPGLRAAGVDFLARSPRISEGAVVLEVNTAANISVHHLPAYGQPVDVGRAIVDAMLAQSPPLASQGINTR